MNLPKNIVLLDKGYPKKNFDFERELIKYGHSGKNSLRADVVVYNVPKSNANPTDVLLVAEIKKNAIHYQLKPVFNQLKNCLYTIYWIGTMKIEFFSQKKVQMKIVY